MVKITKPIKEVLDFLETLEHGGFRGDVTFEVVEAAPTTTTPKPKPKPKKKAAGPKKQRANKLPQVYYKPGGQKDPWPLEYKEHFLFLMMSKRWTLAQLADKLGLRSLTSVTEWMHDDDIRHRFHPELASMDPDQNEMLEEYEGDLIPSEKEEASLSHV